MRLLLGLCLLMLTACAEPIVDNDPDGAWMTCFQRCKGEVYKFELKRSGADCSCEPK